MIAEKIEEFRQCLQEERFYDAHEALEEVWFPQRFEQSDEVKLLKGFINASVSLELIKKGRIPQSKKVWMNYLKYRQLLFKIDSPLLNNYYQLSRYLENIYLHKSPNTH
ncbi:DUF309 domain-containing protein [Sulfurimonas sp.]